MRKTLSFLICTMLALGVAGTASAKTLDWHGTMDIDLGALKALRFGGTGVATVNDSTGTTHLNTIRLAGGITGSGTIPVTDPDTTGTIPSIRISATLGTGTISGISGAPPFIQPATIPVKGFTRVCLFEPGCEVFLPLNNTKNNGATGLGVGGLLTLGGFGSVRISLLNAPWTLGSVTGVTQTNEGAFKTQGVTGFAHGAASTNSSTAEPSGVIQLIAPQQVTTAGIAGNSDKLTLFTRMTLHFVPEPGLMLLIASGVVGLGLLGRSRMKK
jgi:hypothetical protein